MAYTLFDMNLIIFVVNSKSILFVLVFKMKYLLHYPSHLVVLFYFILYVTHTQKKQSYKSKYKYKQTHRNTNTCINTCIYISFVTNKKKRPLELQKLSPYRILVCFFIDFLAFFLFLWICYECVYYVSFKSLFVWHVRLDYRKWNVLFDSISKKEKLS